MNKKKILIITNLFPNPQEPLRGIFIANMVKELREYCSITIVSPLPWFPKLFLFKRFDKYFKFALVPEKFEIDGIEVFSPKYIALPKLGDLHTISLFFSVFGLILKLKKENKFDLINTHWVFPDGVAVSWIACLLKLPHVLTALGTDINLYSTYKLRRPQIVKALQCADKITVVSQAQKELVTSFGIKENKVVVIKNGVDFKRFDLKDKNECRIRLGLKSDSKIILFVGRITNIKKVDYLIDAIDRLHKTIKKDYILVVVGEGDLRAKCEQKTKEINLENNIFFVGEKSGEELPIWYGACDLLCLPSIMEGCPNVILEAIACGRPVVASKVGGIPELVNKQNGILFDKGNIEQLTSSLQDAMETKWKDQEIRNSLDGNTWKNVAEKYLCVYDDCFSKMG